MSANETGAITCTGNGVTLFRLLSLRGMVSLEAKGMRHSSGRSVTMVARKECGLKARAPHADVLAALDAKIEQVKASLQPGEVVRS